MKSYRGYTITQSKFGGGVKYHCLPCAIVNQPSIVAIEREIDRKIHFWSSLEKKQIKK